MTTVSTTRFTPALCIALQTGRAKDKARLLRFIEAGALDVARFQAILHRHILLDGWRKVERQFLNDVQ